jgi:DnaJ-class molecular chaperone
MNNPKLPCRNCGGQGTVMHDFQHSERLVVTEVEQCGLCGGEGFEDAVLATCGECGGSGTAPDTFGELECNYCHGVGEVPTYIQWD